MFSFSRIRKLYFYLGIISEKGGHASLMSSTSPSSQRYESWVAKIVRSWIIVRRWEIVCSHQNDMRDAKHGHDTYSKIEINIFYIKFIMAQENFYDLTISALSLYISQTCALKLYRTMTLAVYRRRENKTPSRRFFINDWPSM